MARKTYEKGHNLSQISDPWWAKSPDSPPPSGVGCNSDAGRPYVEIAGAWKGPKRDEKNPMGTLNGDALPPPNEGKITLRTPQPSKILEVWGHGDPRIKKPGAELRNMPSRNKNHPEVHAPAALGPPGAVEVPEVVCRTRPRFLSPAGAPPDESGQGLHCSMVRPAPPRRLFTQMFPASLLSASLISFSRRWLTDLSPTSRNQVSTTGNMSEKKVDKYVENKC